MKTKFTLLTALTALFFSSFAQQVPNGSFTNWTNGYTPASWVGFEDVVSNALPITSSIWTFKDSTNVPTGYTTAVKLVTDTIPGHSSFGIFSGVISLGTGALVGDTAPTYYGIPFAYKPDTLFFEYEYTGPSGDSAAVEISLTKQDTAVISYMGYGGLGLLLLPTPTWIPVAIPLTSHYTPGVTPDTLSLLFLSSASMQPLIGSTLLIAGVRFGYVNAPAPGITATATAGGTTTFCTGDSVTLTANTGTNYTYQWNFNANAVAGATSSSYVAKATGSYTVTIDSASSTATSSAIVVTDTNCTVGIKTIAATELSVYPNPASSILNINANTDLSGFNLQMFDIVGRLVISQVLDGTNNTVNVAKLANGTYVYRITDKENGIVSQNKFNVVK